MTSALQIALTATPLAAYFYTLGVFHSGRRPRLVAGPVDVGLLAAGLGGLVAFGPFGRSVLGRFAGEPASLLAWSAWVALIGLWALVLAGSASLRATVYHASPDEVMRAVRDSLDRLGGHFEPTLTGFEDKVIGCGVKVRSLRLLRSASVEAYGRGPDALMRALRPHLREALARMPQRPSLVSHALFGFACGTMVGPVGSFFLANPRATEALRALMHSLRWW